MFKSIKVGLYDWVNLPDQNHFYPEDLPEDWRLSFYANEFESACIQVDDSLDIALLEEWIDDLPEDFQLSINVLTAQSIEPVAELFNKNNFKIEYLFIPSQEKEILLQKKSVKALLSILNDNTTDSLQVMPADTIWTPENRVVSSSIALLPETDNKRLHRDWIENWLLDNSQQELTLWLDAKVTRYSSVNELKTLVELMGY